MNVARLALAVAATSSPALALPPGQPARQVLASEFPIAYDGGSAWADFTHGKAEAGSATNGLMVPIAQPTCWTPACLLEWYKGLPAEWAEYYKKMYPWMAAWFGHEKAHSALAISFNVTSPSLSEEVISAGMAEYLHVTTGKLNVVIEQPSSYAAVRAEASLLEMPHVDMLTATKSIALFTDKQEAAVAAQPGNGTGPQGANVTLKNAVRGKDINTELDESRSQEGDAELTWQAEMAQMIPVQPSPSPSPEAYGPVSCSGHSACGVITFTAIFASDFDVSTASLSLAAILQLNEVDIELVVSAVGGQQQTQLNLVATSEVRVDGSVTVMESASFAMKEELTTLLDDAHAASQAFGAKLIRVTSAPAILPTPTDWIATVEVDTVGMSDTSALLARIADLTLADASALICGPTPGCVVTSMQKPGEPEASPSPSPSPSPAAATRLDILDGDASREPARSFI